MPDTHEAPRAPLPDTREEPRTPVTNPNGGRPTAAHGDLHGLVPPLTAGEYDLAVRVLPTPDGGTLLLPTEREVCARYARYAARLKEDLAGLDAGVREQSLAAARAGQGQELAALAAIESQFAGLIARHTFRFRTATNGDVMEAETDALASPVRAASSSSQTPDGPGRPADVRLRPEFALALAERTFVSTDWPVTAGPAGVLSSPAALFSRVLPNAVTEYLLMEVRARIDFATDMVSFWATWGESSPGA